MRDKGTPAELEHRRLLAVQRVLEGYSAEEVAEFLGVDPRSVRRWVAAFRQAGSKGLLARPAAGRPRKLTNTQAKIIRQWLADKLTEHGFPTVKLSALWLSRTFDDPDPPASAEVLRFAGVSRCVQVGNRPPSSRMRKNRSLARFLCR
jgi:transposase